MAGAAKTDAAHKDDWREPADVDHASDENWHIDAKVRYPNQRVGDQDDVLGEHCQQT